MAFDEKSIISAIVGIDFPYSFDDDGIVLKRPDRDFDRKIIQNMPSGDRDPEALAGTLLIPLDNVLARDGSSMQTIVQISPANIEGSE